MDVMRDGAWLVSAAGAFLHQNTAMTSLLQSDPERERIKTALQASARALLALSRPAAGKAASDFTPTVLPVVRTGRATYAIRGSLLEPASASAQPTVLVLLERQEQQAPSPETLQARWGLTPQEARIALLLAGRKRNGEIADLLGISPHTARRHTESVLLKLDVRSRDDVASRLQES